MAVNRLEVGDIVWAKMKSETWWPGHLYNEEFATPLVCRSKREGLLLVALFGTRNSYSWFDSSQLVLFDSNYDELSQQNDSRMFVRAVEDAVKEVSRRIGLGLSCMCRNKQDLMKIDASYAIGKVRESFQPKLAVEFLKELALEPGVSERVDIEFLKNKVTVMSYRKAVYGDFDQASGCNPVRAAVRETAFKEDHVLKDTANFKDDAKKDESKEVKKEKEKVASSLLPVPFKDPTIAAGEYTLKDATGSLEATQPTVSEFSNPCSEMSTSIIELPTSPSVAEVDQAKARFATAEKTGKTEGPQRSDGNYETESSRVLDDLLSLAVDPFNTVNRGSRIKGKKAILRFRSLVFQKSQNFSLPPASDKPNSRKLSEDCVEAPPVKPQGGLKRGPSVRQEERAVAKRKKVFEIRNLTKEKKVMKIDEPAARDVKQPVAATFKRTEELAPEPTMLMMKVPQGGSLPSVSELKASFARYGPMDHSATQIFRNTFSCQVVFRHKAHAEAARRFVVGSNGLFGNTDVKCSLEGVGDVGAAELEPPVEVPEEDQHQPSDRSRSVVSATSGLQLKSIPNISGGEEAAGNGSREVFAASLDKAMNNAKSEDHAKKEETDLSRVLSDLHSLSVDPLNIVNIGSRIKGKKAILRFRSLVFQKGQNFSLPLAASEPNASKSSENSVEVRPVKPQAGLKRGPSDRQEEMALAKRKKVADIRNLIKEAKVTKKIDEPPARNVKQPVAAIKEKKVTKKIDEPPARNVKQPVAAVLKKPGPELINKTERRAPGPTMLMIKFKQGGYLPSFSELKTRFACYGPLDHSGTHIFWNTFSCQVVFRHKAHAEAAYKFVDGSSSLFGNTVIKCSLKDVGIVDSAEPEPAKEDHQQPGTEDRSGVELKSILKKTAGEEAAGNGGRGRVKFMLGGEECQMKNNMENKTSHLTMDFSSKNFQKALNPSVFTGPPRPPMHNGTTLLAPPSPPHGMPMTPLRVLNRPICAQLMTPKTDIAQQMLSLLTRCNDVVTNISSILGYAPYHPL